jgi:hypothetical protein
MSDINNRVKIQNIIESQIPSFLNEDSPLFKEFLNQYYISQEHPTGIADIIANLDRYKDLQTYNNELFFTLFVPCTLTEQLLTFDDEIQVNHTIGFPSSYGLLKIGNEIITYTGKTGTSFTGCSRGFSGIDETNNLTNSSILNFVSTQASDHSLGSTVVNLNLGFYQELFKKFKSQFLPGFENRNFIPQVKIKNILSRAVDFYTTKGTDTSYKILFKVLFNSEISLIKPQDYILRPSDDNYFVTRNILVEKVNGSDPLLIQGADRASLFQDNGEVGSASASIYSIEYRPVDEKDLYEIYLDSTSFISNFTTTKKTNITKSASAFSNTIYVDSTVGYPKSGTIFMKGGNTANGTLTLTYTDKTNTQFLGVSGLIVDAEYGDEVFESNFVYTYDKNNEKIEFRLINVIGEVEYQNTSNLLVNDKIALSSFGAELSDKPEFYSWLYNVSTNHKIRTIRKSGDTSGKIYTIVFYDNLSLYIGQKIKLINPDVSNDTEIDGQVVNIISKNTVEVSSNLDATSKTLLKEIIVLGESDRNHTPSVNNIPVAIQNTYINDSYTSFYVAASGVPNYPLYAKNQVIRTSTPSGVGKTDTLETNIVHNFYTGEKIYYFPSSNSGIKTGIYHVTAIGDNKDSKQVKLSLSKSDLYSNVYINFDRNITSDSFVKLDYENKEVLNQKIFKKFNYIKGDSTLKQVADRTTNNRQIGILANGVEVYSPTLFDENIYYGKIDGITVTNSGRGYDVINPPELEITDVSGKNAKGYVNIVGSLSEVKIVTPGVGYQIKPKLTLVGGNGTGAIVEPNLVKSKITSGFKGDGSGVNPTSNVITFAQKHNFDDGEEISYDSNFNAQISPLKTNANYYAGVISPTQIKLYERLEDALKKNNEINLVGISSGFHSFRTLKSKNTITEVRVKNSGSGYSNKSIKVPATLAFDGKTNGVNTFDHYIFAKNHRLKDKDVLRYSTTGTAISGLSTTSEYVATVLDGDTFKLSAIGVGTQFYDVNYENKRYIKFNSLGIGTHTFSYPPIRLVVETLSGIGATSVIEPQFEPIVLGSIESVFVENTGVGYGVSNIVNFHRRPDVKIKPLISEALLKPIVLNGTIVDIQFLSYGSGYNNGIDIIVNGKGSFADIRPVIENGRLVAVNIANGGINYDKDTTSITIQRRGIDAKFIADIFEWKINQVEKNKKLLEVQDEAFIVPSKNKDLGLQIINFYAPKLLRKTIKDHIDDSNREAPDSVHSPIIGWAYDGNPIYGPYGQVGSQIQKIRSSYTKRVEPDNQLRPNLPDGFFVQDFYYDRAIGDLDEHNGRFCKTPDFPNGIYAYFATIDNSAISIPEFPYIIGNYFRDYVIPENYASRFNQDIDLEELKLIRNIGPYYINSGNSSYSLISNTDKKYKQEFTVTKTLASSIDDIQIYSQGDNYKVGDNVIFDNKGSGGSGASAAVSRVKGKSIKNISVGIKTSLDVSFYTYGTNVVGITQEAHGLTTNDRITISAISNSNYSYLEGIKNIFVSQKTVGLSTNIDVLQVTGETTSIIVNDVSGFEIDDFISIGNEILKITNILTDKSQLTVNRLQNTGVHTVGIDSVRLLPRKFTFTVPEQKFVVKKNSIVYFNPKTFVGFGSTGTNYTLSDQTNLTVPSRSIYIKDHNFITGQAVKYNVGIAGTGMLASNTITQGDAFRLADNQTVYIVNRGQDYIGLSTVGYTTSSGIGSSLSSLYFFDDISVTGLAHSLTTVYEKILGKVENFSLNVETTENHGLSDLDKINFNLLPRLTDKFRLRYDTSIRKITTELKTFDTAVAISTSTSEIYLPGNNYSTGDKIVYYNSGNTSIGGLINNQTYYIIKQKPDYIKLSEFYVTAKSGLNIPFTTTGTGVQSIALINPPLQATKGNYIEFDLSDSSLSGMDLKLYKDGNILIEVESYKYSRNSIDAGVSGAKLVIDTSDKSITNTLFYNLIPLSPSVLEKYQISIDKEVIGHNKITLNPSVYSENYPIISTGSTTFKFILNQKPEYFSYSVNSGITTIFYDTDSANAVGPISKIKLNFGGKGYKKIPAIRSVDSQNGKAAILKASSNTIGKIDYIERVKDGFDYPTDPTLKPVLSVPTVCQIKNISRVDSVGIITGGKNYNISPTLKVIGNDNIKLKANIQGGTVTSVSILENVNNLSSPLSVIATRNSNGYDIDDIVYNPVTNEVTLELVNNDNQIYPLITTQYGNTETVFPFKVGDNVFVENCRITNTSTKNNYNSSNHSYKFFKITGISTSNYTITYSMNGISNNLGEYTTDNNYGFVVNEKDMAKFEMNLADDLGYLSGENVIGYDSNGFSVFSAVVMESGWNNEINQLRLIDSKGELEVGNRLLGTRSLLNGVVENVNQFNLISSLNVTREKINDFTDKIGYLNDFQQRISDNNYYQKFSYAIKSQIPYDTWKEPVRSLIHPAGFKEFSDLDIIGKASNNMKVGIGDSSLNVLINIDSVESMYNRYNFSMVTEDELLPDGSIERVFFPTGVSLKSFILSRTNKVLPIDDISGQFTGFTTTTGGQIVGLTTFKLKNRGTPLFYREFQGNDSSVIDLTNDRFKLRNHNFQSGQKLFYNVVKADGTATVGVNTTVDAGFSYPGISTYFDSPILSFDSSTLKMSSN